MYTFTVTEDELTNAIFNGSGLGAMGGGTKAEARQQARVMLAADTLMTAAGMALARLEAWRDTAADLARRLPDDEATPYRNQADNYSILIGTLKAAVEQAKATNA